MPGSGDWHGDADRSPARQTTPAPALFRHTAPGHAQVQAAAMDHPYGPYFDGRSSSNRQLSDRVATLEARMAVLEAEDAGERGSLEKAGASAGSSFDPPVPQEWTTLLTKVAGLSDDVARLQSIAGQAVGDPGSQVLSPGAFSVPELHFKMEALGHMVESLSIDLSTLASNLGPGGDHNIHKELFRQAGEVEDAHKLIKDCWDEVQKCRDDVRVFWNPTLQWVWARHNLDITAYWGPEGNSSSSSNNRSRAGARSGDLDSAMAQPDDDDNSGD